MANDYQSGFARAFGPSDDLEPLREQRAQKLASEKLGLDRERLGLDRERLAESHRASVASEGLTAAATAQRAAEAEQANRAARAQAHDRMAQNAPVGSRRAAMHQALAASEMLQIDVSELLDTIPVKDFSEQYAKWREDIVRIGTEYQEGTISHKRMMAETASSSAGFAGMLFEQGGMDARSRAQIIDVMKQATQPLDTAIESEARVDEARRKGDIETEDQGERLGQRAAYMRDRAGERLAYAEATAIYREGLRRDTAEGTAYGKTLAKAFTDAYDHELKVRGSKRETSGGAAGGPKPKNISDAEWAQIQAAGGNPWSSSQSSHKVDVPLTREDYAEAARKGVEAQNAVREKLGLPLDDPRALPFPEPEDLGEPATDSGVPLEVIGTFYYEKARSKHMSVQSALKAFVESVHRRGIRPGDPMYETAQKEARLIEGLAAEEGVAAGTPQAGAR